MEENNQELKQDDVEKEERERKEECARLEQSPLFKEVSLRYLDLNKRHNELVAALNDKKFLKNRLRIVNLKR